MIRRTNSNEMAFDEARPYLKMGVVALAALIVAFLAWASLAELDGAVIAPGKVSVEGSRKTVQAAAPGVISELLVRDGDHVAEGQTLVRIDHSVRRAERYGARTRLDALLARRSRLEAERSGHAEVRFDAELDVITETAREAIAAERAQFAARRDAAEAERRTLQASIPRLRATARGHRSRAAAGAIAEEALAQDVESARSLHAQGILSDARLRTLERELARAQGEAADDLAQAETTEHEIEEVRLSLQRRRATRHEEIVRELDVTRRELVEARRTLIETERALRHTAVVAPASGRVFGLAIHTEGGVVREGEELLQIVPDAAPLVVEARVPVHDVDRIEQGQRARVQLSAFDLNDLPPVEGTVASVSADRVEDPTRGTSFYVARIRIDDAAFEGLPGIELRAGMPAETWITTGAKSALQYLVEPLTDGWSRALVDG